MIEMHKTNNAEGTLVTTKVLDPTRYGVIVTDDSCRIQRFVEKPTVFVSD
jgi:mannose-1-phosphate guanylyltransferase